MARLLVMRRDLGPGKFSPGDVVFVAPDNHRFGIQEDIDEWTAAGNAPGDFPDWFYIIDVDGLTVDDAQQFLEKGSNSRRGVNFDIPPGLARKSKIQRAALLARIKRK